MNRSILAIASLGLATSIALIAHAQTTTPSTRPATSPADGARVRELGKRDVPAHDPSTIVRCGDEYWVFTTGRGVPSWHSRDLVSWEKGPNVVTTRPTWIEDAVPAHRGTGFWAPDVIQIGDRYLLFYSCSTFGKQTSAIAVTSTKTLDPASPDYGWTDGGVVVQTTPAADHNAIDPALLRTRDGKLWMAYGSYWSGLKLVELDPTTGKRVNADKPIALAWNKDIEAAYLHERDGKFYLFLNHGICCRGVNSTYEIVVGRADKIEGPYVDRDGKPLLKGGGTRVLSTDGPFIGPGHAGVVVRDGQEWLSGHFYDATEGGRPHLFLRKLSWDADGWPVVE